jgi:hypothetical protein
MTDRVDAKAVLDELLGHIKHLDGDPHVRGWYGAWMLSAANALRQTLADLEAAEKAVVEIARLVEVYADDVGLNEGVLFDDHKSLPAIRKIVAALAGEEKP